MAQEKARACPRMQLVCAHVQMQMRIDRSMAAIVSEAEGTSARCAAEALASSQRLLLGATVVCPHVARVGRAAVRRESGDCESKENSLINFKHLGRNSQSFSFVESCLLLTGRLR